MKFLKAFCIEHPGVKIKSLSTFQTRDLGIHTKYGFSLDDLEKHVYIIYEDKLLKGDI